MNKAENYADQIIRDELDEIAAETPTIYEDDRIERVYTFKDGAIVKYEWRRSDEEKFNHRFTLVKTPDENPNRLKEGIIRTINY